MDGRSIGDQVKLFRDRLDEYDRQSNDEPLVTLLEKTLKIIESLGEAVDGLENRVDVLEESVESS